MFRASVHPDPRIDEALRHFVRRRRKEAAHPERWGSGKELTKAINGLAKSSIAQKWHRDDALKLVTAIALHPDETEAKSARFALRALADVLDNIEVLSRVASQAVEQHLNPRSGGPKPDIALKLFVGRLMAIFEEDHQGQEATVIIRPDHSPIGAGNSDGSAPPEGPFIEFAEEVCGYLPGDIAPSVEQIAARVRDIRDNFPG